MKYLVIACLAVAIAGCSDYSAPTAQPGVDGLAEGYALGQPITHGNATFIPVLSTVPDEQLPESDTITLAEATKNGTVEIIEIPGEEQVEFLSVRNTGDKPIFLMSGQLLLGGKQDRIVAEDTLIPAGKTIRVRVYCVEHGRWSGSSAHFDYGETMVPDKVRKSAQYEDQEAVWGSVAEKNQTVITNSPSTGAQSSSIKTFLNDQEVQQKVKLGAMEILDRLRDPNVVGVVFVLNGEIQTFELFATPGLFTQAVKPLIESFLAEAVMVEKSDKKLDKNEVVAFVQKCLAAPQGDDAGTNRVAAAGIRGNQYKAAEAAAPMHGSFEPTK